jgi:excisionase family DNA binding protein
MLTVQEVADYLRLKERKIYYLVAQKRIPCVRVSGKWLFPRERIDQWLRDNSKAGDSTPVSVAALPPPVLSGSHDPLLEWALRECGSPLAAQTTGSEEGLQRFAAGRASVCGLHLPEADGGEFNLEAVKRALPGQGIVLIEWAWREQGLIVAAGNPQRLSSLADLKTAPARLVERQPGSGGHALFRALLARQGIEPASLDRLPEWVRSETDLGLAVLGGKADAGLGLAAVARLLQLDFIPLARERFDLLLRRRDYFELPFQSLLAFTRTPAFQEKARGLGGYDIAQLGRVHYNAP